jgi:hypothetical protein
MRFLVWAALALCASSAGADPIALYCARGVADYPDAEVTLSASGTHILNVTYVGYRPSRVRAEWSLRDCLNTAMKLDASRRIVGSLWYRERRSPAPHELLLRVETAGAP